MKLPRELYRLLKTLHKPSKIQICVRGMMGDSIVVDRGVKQGDPCAMLLFIVAYDPLIKFI